MPLGLIIVFTGVGIGVVIGLWPQLRRFHFCSLFGHVYPPGSGICTKCGYDDEFDRIAPKEKGTND